MRTFISRLPRYASAIRTPSYPRHFTMSSTSYSTSNDQTPTKDEESQQSTDAPKQPLALPASSSDTTKLDMSNGNTTVSLDHLGPMVVNVDGTMSRISNWDKMAEIEKKATIRIIGKRNKARLEALKQAKGEGEP